MTHHTRLIGLSDRELLLCAGDATHQHYKGGLYRLHGLVRDAEDGEPVRGQDGLPRVLYFHCYPHERAAWVRDHSEFFGLVDDEQGRQVRRFRPLGTKKEG